MPKDARSVGVVATDFLFESDFRVSTCGGDLTYEAENQNKLTKSSCTFKYSSINSFEYFMKKRLPGNIFTFCSLLRLNKRNQMQRNLQNRIKSQDRGTAMWRTNMKEVPS